MKKLETATQYMQRTDDAKLRSHIDTIVECINELIEEVEKLKQK